MKKYILFTSLILALLGFSGCSETKRVGAESEYPSVTSKTYSGGFNFIVISDWGWNGFGHQQLIADQMARTADSIGVRFIASCGDNFQVNGVASTADPLWNTSFENVYKEPSLMVDWYPVFGNHDYKGSTQAQIDYSKISRRWRFTDHYYSFAKKINDSISARFIFLDTPPFISEYHKAAANYPDINMVDTAKEVVWLEEVLANSKEQWKLVFGHHPIYSASSKHGNSTELIERVKPLLEKYNAQFYFSGHDHDLQHSAEKEGSVDYIVNGTAGKFRNYSQNELTIYSNSLPAFSVVSLKGDSLQLSFVNADGKMVYQYGRRVK